MPSTVFNTSHGLTHSILRQAGSEVGTIIVSISQMQKLTQSWGSKPIDSSLAPSSSRRELLSVPQTALLRLLLRINHLVTAS